MPARSPSARIEVLESRKLLSAAVAAALDHGGVGPAMHEFAIAKSAAQTAKPSQIIRKTSALAAVNINLSPVAMQANPAALGTSLQFDVIVTPAMAGGPAFNAADTVTFFDNSTSPASFVVMPLNTFSSPALSTWTTSTLSLGTHPIYAVFNGDANYAVSGNSNTFNQVIGTPTISTVVTNMSPALPGATVQFTANVVPNPIVNGQPAVTGSVTFTADGTNVLGMATISGGMASLNVSTLISGLHSITATYSGDTNYVTSTSSSIQQMINTPTTTTLAATTAGMPTPAMVVPSTMVTLTATIAPTIVGGPAITGDTVTFLDNAIAIGTALTTNGVASLPAMTLPNGANSLTATYPGDTNYRPSATASALSIAVGQVTTTNTLVAQTPSVAVGANAIFQATISPAPANAGESISFYDSSTGPATLLGMAPLFNGVSTFTINTLSLGSHTVYAVYSGDANYTMSTSNNVMQTVALASITTITSPTSGGITPGTPVSITASVVDAGVGGPVPTGSVTFLDNGSSIGMANLNGTAMATLANVTLPNGLNSLTAMYTGSPTYVPSTTMVAVNVPVGFGTGIAVTAPASAALGSSVTLTATIVPVNAGGLLPTGTITFYDGGNALSPNATIMNGVATITLTTLPTGSNIISAQYGGDANFDPNNISQMATVMIGAALGINPTVSLATSAPLGAGLGSPVTFTATVTGSAMAPTGTVTFENGGVAIAGPVMLSMAGVATLTTTTLPAGSDTITAVYSGDTNYNTATSTPFMQMINNVASTPTSSTLTTSAAGAVSGIPVIFTDTVSPLTLGGPVPTGTVIFTATYTMGMMMATTTFGPIAVGPNGTAMLTTAALPVGTDTVTAAYTGDLINGPSVSPAVTETIGMGPAQNVNLQAFSSTLNTAVGGAVTLTAQVVPVGGATTVPTGTVTFYLNGFMGIVLGTATVSNIGTAVLPSSSFLVPLPAGADPISASYSGDSVYAPAKTGANAINISVGAATGNLANTIVVTTSNASVPVGTPVTFTATITPMMNGLAQPTGTITFYNDGVAIGTVNVVNYMAMLTTSTLPNGLDTITATYSGDSNYTSSTSVAITETIGVIVQTQTVTDLVTANPDVTIGGTAMLTATVSAAGGGTIPTGIISFIEGTATIGSAPVQPDGTATFSFPALMQGIDQIRATYDGALLFSASTSAPITETVGPATPASTTTTVTGMTGILPSGGTDVFTALVVPVIGGGLAPTGMVTFYDGPTDIGVMPLQSTGAAVLTTSDLPNGINNVTAVYGGDTVYTASTSPAFPVGVGDNTPTYSTALNVSTGTAAPLAPVVFTAIVAPTAAGAALPSGDVTFFFGPNVLGVALVQANGTATFTTTALPTGTDYVTATFAGSTGVSGPSPVITEFITALPPSTSLPSVSGETIPSGIVVGGTKTLLKLPVTITNTGPGIAIGDFTLNVYFNTTTTLDGHEVLVSSGTKFMSLDPTASKLWKYQIKSLPATLLSNTYHIIVQSVDPNGGTAATFTIGSIQIAAPVVTLTATTSTVSPASLQVGQTGSVLLTVTNTGNILAVGPLTVVVSLSSDGVTPLPLAKNTLTIMSPKVSLKPGQSRTFHVSFRPTAVVAAGDYYAYITASLDNYSTTVVGTVKFHIS